MFKAVLLIFIIRTFVLVLAENYGNYKVYEIFPQKLQQIIALHNMKYSSSDKYDFWSISRILNEPTKVMVSPQYQNNFLGTLSVMDIPFKLIYSDVSKELSNYEFHEENKNDDNQTSKIDFKKFHRFKEINEHLTSLANKYQNRVKITKEGESNEGRELLTIKVSNGDTNDNDNDKSNDKKLIFVDAGIHAREWIAPATALYVIHQLIENFEENSSLLRDYDWIILPVVNPDGYEYSHTKERFWRKTRSSHSPLCSGVDGNRNFDYHWSEVGSSKDACSEIYHGPKPFSEPETKIVRDILKRNEGKCKFYLSLHSFGNYLLYPWGWTSELPESVSDLDKVAQTGAKAIYEKTGTNYTVGSSTNVLYAAAGGSDDYAFAVTKVPISITMELPGNGFNPKPSEIHKYVTEAWIGIRAMAEQVMKMY